MKRDLTVGSERKVLIEYALPLMGATFLQVLYSFADSLIVARYVGATAFGAVGLLSAVVMLLNSSCTSVGAGVSIITSQFFGAGKEQDVREAVSTGLVLSMSLSLLIVVLMLGLSRWLVVGLLGTPSNMQAYSLVYLRLYVIGLLFQMLYQVTYGILRAHGDSKGAMLFLLISAVLNIGLDLLFVKTFQMEVMGAALATVIAQAGAAAAALIYLVRHLPHLSPFRRKNFLLRREKGMLITKMALPMFCQSAIHSIGFIILQRLCNSFGQASIEGYAAMQKIESFIHIVPNALNTAMAGFSGQNIGAGKPKRIVKGYRFAVVVGLCFCVVLATVMIIYDRPLLSIFNISEEGLIRGCQHLDILVIFMLFNTAGPITAGLLQGAGDVRVTAVASFVNLFIRVSSAYLMAGTFVGYRCIFWSLPPAWVAAFLIIYLRYRSGIWKTKAVTGSIEK